MAKKNKLNKTARNLNGKKFLLSSYLFMIAVCFVIPVMHFQILLDPVIFSRFTALAAVTAILAILLFFKTGKSKISTGILKNSFMILFLVFIFISITSLFFAINPIEGLSDIFKWMFFFVFTWVVLWLFTINSNVLLLLLKGLVIHAIIFSIAGLVQYFEKAYLNTDVDALYEVKVLMGHKNQYSISLMLLIPFIISAIITLEKAWRILAVFSLLLVFVMILILQTRAVWIALFFSFILLGSFFLVLNHKKQYIHIKNKTHKTIIKTGVLAFVMILLVIIFFPVGPLEMINRRISTIFNPEFTSNAWRFEMWKSTLVMAKDYSLTGVGAGNWKINIYPYYSDFLPSVFRHWRNPHNDYLLIWSEKGIPGLISFGLMFITLIITGLQNLFRAADLKKMLTTLFFVLGVLSYAIVSFFSFPNERISHFILISIMAAVLISENISVKMHKAKSFNKKALVVPVLVVCYLAIHFGVIAIKSEAYVKNAFVAQEKKDWKVMKYFAEKSESKWAPIEPKSSFPISTYIGIAEYHLKNYNEALAQFKKAYHLHPHQISILNNLGSIYGVLKEYDSAIVYHQKTLEIFPHYEEALLNLSKTYYLNNDFEKAYQLVLYCDPKSTNKEVNLLRTAIEVKLD